MFLFTRNGVILVALGFGIMLGFCGLSEALVCWKCDAGAKCAETDCPGNATKVLCSTTFRNTSALVSKQCTSTDSYKLDTCQPITPTDNSSFVCTCNATRCNDDSLILFTKGHFKKSSSVRLSPTVVPVLATEALLVLTLDYFRTS